MKKIVLYILLLGAALLLPVEGEDVGKLLPVEVVQLDKTGDTLVISTDADAKGTGTTMAAAVQNMHATADGIVFLDTADFLLVTDAAKQHVEDMTEYLKPSVRVCMLRSEVDLKEAAGYLRVHKPQQHLRDWETAVGAEYIDEEDGRMILEEN